MDTAERVSGSAAPGSATYDGFISYSHAADDLLAPRLQAGLQRFAKPWWKRRAVRIFRDESSLAANPHLWSSITDALDDSSWFVLLLSEDAASSEWVGKEIEHWIDHKPSDRILPVVTDGTFGWENGDVTGTSVPPALHGVFSEEPRWVDLRFARDEEQLDLQNPDFSAAVADIAATIRGIPKDELASEEVKQHRRTVRTAWAAGIGLAVLAVAAIVAGVFAVGQRNDARDAQDLAEQEASRANLLAEQEAGARNLADQNALLAEEQAALAARNADLAFSRELAASAVSVLDTDPELSLLLALESLTAIPAGEEAPFESVVALRQAIQRHSLVDRTLIAGDDTPESSFRFGDVIPAFADLSPDGSRYAWFSEVETVHLFDTSSWEEVWVRKAANESGVWFSADGNYVGYGVSADDSGPARIIFLETESGDLLEEVPFEGCDRVNLWGQSPTDRVWAVSVPSESDCGQGEATGPRVFLLDGFKVVSELELEVGSIFALFWVADGHMVVDDIFALRRFDPRTGEVFVEATQEDFFWSMTVSPDGKLLAGAQLPSFEVIRVYDAQTLQQTDILTGIPFSAEGIAFSGDGSVVFAGSRGDVAFGWDLETGKPIHALAATGKGLDVEFDDDRELLYLMGPLEVTRWDLSGRGEVLGLGTGVFPNANDLDAAGGTLAWKGGSPGFEQNIIGVFDAETLELGPLLRAHMPDRPAVLPDGRVVLMQGHDRDADTGAEVAGPVVIWDPVSGETTPLVGCRATIADDVYENPEAGCLGEGEEWVPAVTLVLDPTREKLLVGAADGELLTFDAESLDPISRRDFDPERGVELYGGSWLAVGDEARRTFGVGSMLTIIDADTFEDIAALPGTMVALSDDGALLALHGEAGRITLYDTATWQPLREFGAGESRIRGLSFSPNGLLILSAGSDGFVRIWDVTTGAEIHRLPVESPADGAWIDDDHVAVVSRDRLEVFTLDVNELLSIAGDRLIRGLTSDECSTYRIDPCPSLDEIRGR